MAIGAHPSDVELHCGAALARLMADGARVTLFLCSDEGCELSCSPGGGADRRREAGRAAAVLGAEEVVWADADAGAQREETLMRQLVREIRRTRPDLLLAHDPTNWWRRAADSVRLGRADHREAGRLALEAVHPRAAAAHFFPELTGEGIAPWLVREVWLYDTPDPDHLVDVDPTWEIKVAALACHASQLPARLVEEAAADAQGRATGHGRGAEGFRRLCLL
jgi:LmbE family N-acetylglucosaminyl deacetylase